MSKKHPMHQNENEKLLSKTESTVSAIEKNTIKSGEIVDAVKSLESVAKDTSDLRTGFIGVVKSNEKTRDILKKSLDDLKDYVDHPEVVVKKLEEIKSASLITNKTLKEIRDKEEKEPVEEMNVTLKGISVITLKGDKGDKGDKGEKGDSVKGDTGPEGKQGKEGKASTVPGPQGKIGLSGKDGLDGEDGKDGVDGSPDTPDEVVEKVNIAVKKIDPKSIKGLPLALESLERISKSGVGVGGGGPNIRYRNSSNGVISEYVTDIKFDTGITPTYSNGVITLGASSGGGTWGSITGTLSDQTDLQTALDGKLSDSGDTGTGAYDFGGATTFEIPNSATPTLNATGQIAVDTTVTDFTNGLLKYYSTAEYGVVSMPITAFASPTNGYVVAYNSTNDAFELVAQSGGGGGITIGTTTITSGTANRILIHSATGDTVQEDAGLTWDFTQNKLSIVGSSTVNISSPATNSVYTGAYPASITSGINITAYGIGAANSATSATSIVAIGTSACNTITTALFTIGIGALAFQNASPTRGVAVGASAQANNTGTDAFSFGNLSMGSATSESFSLVAGTNAGSGMTVGFWNNGIGGSIFATNGAAYGNTGMGHASGQTVGGSFAANRNTFYGYASDIAAGLTGAMALGAGAIAKTSNTIVIGGTVTAPTRVYFGLGEKSGTATAIILSATNGDGADKAGGDLILAGGQNTSAGTPGYVYIRTAATTTTGSVLQSLVNRARYTSTYFESSTTSSFAMPFAAGSATAPTYSFLGDTNTGIYSDTADVVQVTTGGTKRLDVDAVGNIRAYTLHDNATAQGSATQQDIRSGTYTPTLTGVTNVTASTARKLTWKRVGNTVSVYGQLDLDPDVTLTLTQLGISLPVASALATAFELGGTGASKTGNICTIEGDAANNRAQLEIFAPVDVTNQTITINFGYEVL